MATEIGPKLSAACICFGLFTGTKENPFALTSPSAESKLQVVFVIPKVPSVYG